MKKQISGKLFTGSPDSGAQNSLAVCISDACEGADELKQLYAQYGRELFDSVIVNDEHACIAFFSWDGELYEFEGELDCEAEELSITSFVEVKA